MTAPDSTLTKKILIVDDEAPMAQMWRKKFEREGYRVDIASNGEKALDEMQKDTFDAIILDLYMPLKNGFEVLREKGKTKNSGVPVYVVTGSVVDDDLEKAKELGAKQTFLKYRTSPQDVVTAVKEG